MLPVNIQILKLLKKLLNNKYEMNLSEELSLIAIQGPKAVKNIRKNNSWCIWI